MDKLSITEQTTLSEQLQEQPTAPVSFGSTLVASLSISLFLVIGYLLIKWFKF